MILTAVPGDSAIGSPGRRRSRRRPAGGPGCPASRRRRPRPDGVAVHRGVVEARQATRRRRPRQSTRPRASISGWSKAGSGVTRPSTTSKCSSTVRLTSPTLIRADRQEVVGASAGPQARVSAHRLTVRHYLLSTCTLSGWLPQVMRTSGARSSLVAPLVRRTSVKPWER